jgi:hypothetical protein
MDLTIEKFDDLLRLTLEKAKTNRAKFGYSGEAKFAPCALVIGPHCEQAVLPMKWSTAREKRVMMAALSHAARSQNASAVVLITDVRWCDAQKFSDYFHLEPVAKIGLEAWEKEYSEIIRGVYGNMSQLPRELWSEAVTVAGKGPLVGEQILMATYREGKNDSVEWVDEGPKKDAVNMYLLEDWWEPTTKQ